MRPIPLESPRAQLRHARLWIAGGVVLVLLIVYLSLAPGKLLPQVKLWDKLEHTLAYVGLSLWFAALVERRRYWRVATLLVLLGVFVELAQGAMNLGRSAQAADLIANGLGIAVGLGGAHLGLGSWMRWVERACGAP